MGQLQSKDKLLYRHAVNGNVQAIKTLRRDGARLEWVDKKGRTPLMAACMSSKSFAVAKTLIELGADVNAYQPGHNAGTPLHHAASRGLHNIVQLLLFHGVNALIKNDDSQTPLQVARVKGYTNVVRTIESNICIFSGWLKEFYGPSFLEVMAPKLLSREIWAVVVPHDSSKPLKLELAIYSSLKHAQPRTVIYLWKTNVEKPNFQQLDPAVIISDKSTKSEYKFAIRRHGEQHQLHSLYKACIGAQVKRPGIANNFQMWVLESTADTAAEAMELARGISASIQSSTETREPRTLIDHSSEANNVNGWSSLVRPTPSGMSFQKTDKLHNSPLCIICWESPVEAACVPCGHMFGCLSCSNDIKSKKGVCPVCRQKID